MRTISPYARNLCRNMTEAERAFWSALRNRQVGNAKFRRQWTVGPYIADFACIEAQLIVELDGGRHAENPADDARTRWLEQRGWRVIRFWNHDVLDNREGVLETIAAALTPSSTLAIIPLRHGEARTPAQAGVLSPKRCFIPLWTQACAGVHRGFLAQAG